MLNLAYPLLSPFLLSSLKLKLLSLKLKERLKYIMWDTRTSDDIIKNKRGTIMMYRATTTLNIVFKLASSLQTNIPSS